MQGDIAGILTTSSSYPGGANPPYPTTTPPYPITTAPPTYVTPSLPSTSCIGVEIIVSVTVVESCSTVAPGSTSRSTLLNKNTRNANINVFQSPTRPQVLSQLTKSQSTTPLSLPCPATSAP